MQSNEYPENMDSQCSQSKIVSNYKCKILCLMSKFFKIWRTSKAKFWDYEVPSLKSEITQVVEELIQKHQMKFLELTNSWAHYFELVNIFITHSTSTYSVVSGVDAQTFADQVISMSHSHIHTPYCMCLSKHEAQHILEWHHIWSVKSPWFFLLGAAQYVTATKRNLLWHANQFLVK